jgi:hypothetical protein
MLERLAKDQSDGLDIRQMYYDDINGPLPDEMDSEEVEIFNQSLRAHVQSVKRSKKPTLGHLSAMYGLTHAVKWIRCGDFQTEEEEDAYAKERLDTLSPEERMKLHTPEGRQRVWSRAMMPLNLRAYRLLEERDQQGQGGEDAGEESESEESESSDDVNGGKNVRGAAAKGGDDGLDDDDDEDVDEEDVEAMARNENFEDSESDDLI